MSRRSTPVLFIGVFEASHEVVAGMPETFSPMYDRGVSGRSTHWLYSSLRVEFDNEKKRFSGLG
jgi:hypothetical protein